MEITVSGRHFEISESVRERVASAIQAEFGDLSLKIVSAQAVLDMQDSKRAKVTIVVNIKHHTATAEVEDFDLFKAVDAAIAKTSVQARKLIDKRNTGKQGERFSDVEVSEVKEEEE